MIWGIAIITGFIIGWIVSSSRRTASLFASVMIGTVGALLGTWFFISLLGITTSSSILSVILNIIWSIIGAGILLSISEALNIYEYEKSSQEEVARGRPVAHEYDEERERKRTEWEREKERLEREQRDRNKMNR